MPQVHFTAHLRSVIRKSPLPVDGADVRDALRNVFREHPQLEGYVLDERGALRQHVCIFLDGERLLNGEALDAPVASASEIYVMQALSGG
jgi:molybdopterin converting factor small subunit